MTWFYPSIAFLVCLILTPVIKKVAVKRNWLAHPADDRWHKQPTALMGGIAIYSGICVPLLVFSDFPEFLSSITHQPGSSALPSFAVVTWIGVTALFVLGLLDDILRIKPHSKLMGQIMVSALVVFLGYRLQWFTSMTLDTLVTLIWIVGVTNAFNLIDNMDGLCSGVGMIAALFFVVILWGPSSEASVVGLILTGSLAAFLIYNFHPASIFMGDSGSLLIGFTVAMLGLNYAETTTAVLPSIAVPVVIVMVPILDTTFVTLVRILSGRKASAGGRDHTSHRLVLMGLSEKSAVLILWGIGVISGIGAVFVDQNDTLTSPGVLIPLLVALILMAVYLSQLRVYPEKEFSVLRGKTFTPVLLELTYKRHLVLVILDFCMIVFCYYFAWRLRFDAEQFPLFFPAFLKSLPAVIICKFVAYFTMGVYRNIWGVMSSDEVFTGIKASTMATILSVTLVTFIYRFENFSKGIFVIDWLLTAAALLGTRGFFRLSGDMMKRKTLDGDQALIYGAGRGGELLLREILNNRELHVKPVGFIDDDPLKTGKKLQGYKVLGTFQNLEAVIHERHVSLLLISFQPVHPDKMSRIHAACIKNRLDLKHFSIQLNSVNLLASGEKPG